ncbi:hypothetical protein BCR32DRAFT_327540 [Anaeromyces robustus]|uniref:Uncharacterized protein n=1 Tax=Anaeromyces robustus TaxID=1754192 RepID=A0A1Y1X6I4_9FUNG|nr:hypothetical protein BCR32DRAFT_327540 [Anaeromyces robustus]|eukprot:ORX80904.1 hypothetical protein BCR32DRAFT_327540 [Anaeromyces robustus]
MIHLLSKKPFSFCKDDDEEKSTPTYETTPSINKNNERRPPIYNRKSSSNIIIDCNIYQSRDMLNSSNRSEERYERTDGMKRSLRKSDVSISSITPIVLFNIAKSNGTFAESLVTKNGFAIGNYYRYWQNLFDLRPCPSIYSITITYEILGKEEARNFLLKHFEEKFIWLHDSFPLGFMYNKSHGPISPPSTIEMMYAFGERSWIDGHAEYLVRYTRNAKTYMKDLSLCSSDNLDDLPPLDMDVLIEAVSNIIY